MLSEEAKITKGADEAAAGTTTVTGDPLDMSGWEGVVILTTIGTANSGNYLKAQQGQQSNMSDAADLAGTKVVATGNGEVVGIDLYRPRERYVCGVMTRGVSTASGTMFYVQYRGRKAPAVNVVTDTITIEKHVSPAEGTP